MWKFWKYKIRTSIDVDEVRANSPKVIGIPPRPSSKHDKPQSTLHSGHDIVADIMILGICLLILYSLSVTLLSTISPNTIVKFNYWYRNTNKVVSAVMWTLALIPYAVHTILYGIGHTIALLGIPVLCIVTIIAIIKCRLQAPWLLIPGTLVVLSVSGILYYSKINSILEMLYTRLLVGYSSSMPDMSSYAGDGWAVAVFGSTILAFILAMVYVPHSTSRSYI